MLFSTSAALSVLATLPRLVSSALIPHADSPVFYLMGMDPYGDNFLPLRYTGQHGVATLTGSGPIAMLYQINGTIVGQDELRGSTSPKLYHPYVDFSLPSPAYLSPVYPVNLTTPNFGECGPSGRLMFVQDVDGVHESGVEKVKHENPCAEFEPFTLFSDRMDAQLGAKLVFRTNLTFFWACGNLRDIVYKTNDEDMPDDCVTMVQLFTLPVV
ncbi:hypothetical protein DFP72DRAFT_388722 [Ephemerocybe angulata]|uniref:Uncharacterized protein n=1 Tax=Ephemerocybe angulata TaxID=980116 RepID=A0A8H6M5R9_9AGAR|nr:hypothetical protein DFP72DRAFT_388722 [Tulosesus angulatus]